MLDLIRKRILANEPPNYLTPGSTAVVSFGDFTKSTIATLSINPSSKEFYSGKRLIRQPDKRLVDKETLGLRNSEAVRDEHWEAVWEGCKNYFSPTGKPYFWFDDLQIVLGYLNVNYKNNSACHLDLVQWATTPSWKSVPADAQSNFLKHDADFFQAQINSKNLDVIVINGSLVFEVVAKTAGFDLRKIEPIYYSYKGRSTPNYRFVGKGPNGKKVIGWTGTLRNMRVDNPTRIAHCHELGEWLVKEL